MQQFQRFYWVTVHIRKSVNWKELGPNLWISHDWARAQPWVGLGGHRPTHPLGSQAQPIRKRLFVGKNLITDRNTPQLHYLSRWLVSDDPSREEARCGGPGLAWLHVVCGCEAGWMYCFKTTLEAADGREVNIKFSGNSSGGHSCSQHANCTLPRNLRHFWHCAVWFYFWVAFDCPRPKAHLCNDHAV